MFKVIVALSIVLFDCASAGKLPGVSFTATSQLRQVLNSLYAAGDLLFEPLCQRAAGRCDVPPPECKILVQCQANRGAFNQLVIDGLRSLALADALITDEQEVAASKEIQATIAKVKQIIATMHTYRLE